MAKAKPSYDELAAMFQQQALEIERLKRHIAELEQKLQESHRQVAPFRRRDSQKKLAGDKKPPGRPEGHPGTYRPPPDELDGTEQVPLPCCPHCQGPVTNVAERVQYLEELPPIKPLRLKVITYTGHCLHCGDVASTHPLQTSTATGAAGTHLGPRAQALAVSLAHESGLSMRKACETLQRLSGLKLSPGGLAQLLQRVAGRCAGEYERLVQEIRNSAAVFADETSWYVGTPGWWLWVFTTPRTTLYCVDESRGSDVVQRILTSEFRGMLVSDCLASYNVIDCRKHKCIAHHLRVLQEHEDTLLRRGVKSQYLTLWKRHLGDVIETWNNRVKLSAKAYAQKVAQLRRGVRNLLQRAPPEPEEVRFRDRLARQQEHLLGCLEQPAAEPTNNRAERDLRPAVINRKISCGNRTQNGKAAWEIVRSVVVSVQKQGRNVVDTLASRLHLTAQVEPAPAQR